MKRAFILFILSLFLLVSCNGEGDNNPGSSPNIHDLQIGSLEVQPSMDTLIANGIIPVGVKVPFSAVAFDKNDNKIVGDYTHKVVWGNESNNSVATIDKDTGVLEALASGEVTVTATYPDSHIIARKIVHIESSYVAAQINIIKAPFSLSLLPKNTTEQLKAMVSFTARGGALVSFDASNSRYIKWKSDDPSISVNNTNQPGLITILESGRANITATWQMPQKSRIISAEGLHLRGSNATLDSISLEPTAFIRNNAVPAGVTIGYKAIGHYNDGRSYDISNIAIWQKDSHININNGLITTINPGKVTIAASYGGQDAKKELTISADQLSAIHIELIHNPHQRAILVNGTVAFKALGVYKPSGASYDISSLVIWRSESSSIMISSTGDSAGIAKGVATTNGQPVKVWAQLNSINSNKYPLTVIDDNLGSNVFITPVDKLLYTGIPQQYSIIGLDSVTGYQIDLTVSTTWSGGGGGGSIITSGPYAGLLTPGGFGDIVVASSLSDRNFSTTYRVDSNTILKNISINGAPKHIAKYLPITLSAQATFSTGNTQDITNSGLTLWSTSNPDVIRYTGTNGKFVSQTAGTAVLTATFITTPGTIESASVTVIVNNATIKSLAIDPITSNIAINGSRKFRATLIDSNNNTYPAGDFGVVSWTSEDPADLAIDTVTGMATAGAVAKKDITISAKLTIGDNPILQSTATTNIIASTLQGIDIKPHKNTLMPNSVITYHAEKIYSNSVLKEPLSAPTQVVWSATTAGGATVPMGTDGTFKTTAGMAGDFIITAQAITDGKLDTRPEAIASIPVHVTLSVDDFESIEIRSDASGDLALGDKRHYHLIIHYQHHDITYVDPSRISWSSSKESVATINSISSSDDFGVAAVKGPGSTVISAVLEGYETHPAEVTLTVNPDLKLESIVIAGSAQAALHDVRSYRAYGAYYANGQLVDTKKDITNKVSWTINDSNVGSFGGGDNSNQLTIRGVGNTLINAVYNNESAIFDLSVEPTSHVESLVISSLGGGDVVKVGANKQYKLMVYYNDLPSYDATNDAIWLTESLAMADIDSHAKLSAVSEGDTKVLAYYASESTNQVVHIVKDLPANALESIWLVDGANNHNYTSSESLVLAYKDSRQFILEAKYKDGTLKNIDPDLVNWISTQPSKVSFNNGLVVALESNVKVAISASYTDTDSGITITTPLVIINVPSEALSKLVINPVPDSIAAGSTYTFSTVGYFGTGDVSGINPLLSGIKWVSSDTSKLSFDDSSKGEAIIAANASGPVIVSVLSFTDATVESHLTVQIINGAASILKSISIEPESYVFTESGETKDYQVIAHYAESSLNHVVNPSDVQWSSDNESAITINKITGVATAISQGSTVISAIYRTESAKVGASFGIAKSITNLSLTSLGGIHIYKLGLSAKANLIATNTKKGKIYVSSIATWTPANPAIVTITRGAKPSDPVTIVGLQVGSTTIKVSYEGLTTNLNVSVEDDAVAQITLLPVESFLVGVGEELPHYYQVMGYFKAPNNVMHNQLIESIVTALNLVANNNRVTITKDGTLSGISAGAATITATYFGESATTNVIVDSSVKLESLMVLPRIATTVPNNLVCYVVLARIGNHMINVSQVADIDAGAAGHSIAGANCRDSNSDLEGVYVKVAGQTTANPVEVKVSYANMTVAAGTLKVVALDTLGPISIDPVDQTIVGNSMHRGTYEQFIAHDDQNTDISGLVNWMSAESSSLHVGANGLVYAPESANDVPNGVTITATYPGVNSATYAQSVSNAGYPTDPTTPALEMHVLSGNGDNVGDALPLHVGNKAYLQVIANYTDGSTQDISDYATVITNNPKALAYNPLTGFVTALNSVSDDKSVGLKAWYNNGVSTVIPEAESGVFINHNTIDHTTINSTNSFNLNSGVTTRFTLNGVYAGEDGSVDLTYDGFWQGGACSNGVNCGIDIIPLGQYAGNAIAYGSGSGSLVIAEKGFNPNNLADYPTVTAQVNP